MKKYIILSIILLAVIFATGFVVWKRMENQDPHFWFSKSLSSQSKGNYDEAIKYYDKAIELMPESTSLRIYERNANGTNNHNKAFKCYEKAIECYEKGIKLNCLSPSVK